MQEAPPQEVLLEFVRLLNQTVLEYEETLVPVLRGSLLLRHWFGDHARRAADLDLECFERAEPPEDGIGPYDEYQSLVDNGKAMCRYAAETSELSRNTEGNIFFRESNAPGAEGASLWAYGTPGERYFAGWVMRGHPLRSGLLQIDIAESDSYTLDDISIADIELGEGADRVACPAYTPEMLLAAKLSWLMRSLTRRTVNGNIAAPRWHGELKDLFDTHLLLKRAELDAASFQKSLLALGAECDLEWSRLAVLFDVQRAPMSVQDFPGWHEFVAQRGEVVVSEPHEMLQVVAERLEPLLGDFYLRQELPFIFEIHADPADEAAYAIYADWLDERGSSRAQVVRQFREFKFHSEELPADELTAKKQELQTTIANTSLPWLHQFFGQPSRLRQALDRIAS